MLTDDAVKNNMLCTFVVFVGADETFVYIIVGAVGGFVVIVVILLATLFVCYMCNRRMKAHKHRKQYHMCVHVLRTLFMPIANDIHFVCTHVHVPVLSVYDYAYICSLLFIVQKSALMESLKKPKLK